MNVELRPARVSDSQFVYDVTEAAMRGYVEATFGPWVPSFQQEIIRESFDPATHRVILVNELPAGILAVQSHDTHVQLEKLYLLPDFQRKGVGSLLLEQLLQSSSAQSKPVRLRVLTVNIAARRLYERLGFVVASVTPERVFMEYSAPTLKLGDHDLTPSV